MKNRAHFTLLPLMHWVAVVMLAGSAIVALSGFLSLPAAVAAGTVLTFLLKTLLEQAIEAFYGRRWVFGTVYAVGGFAIVCVTTALTAATLYARVFAEPSARADWTERREPVERELQRIVAQARTAELAMADWAKDAQQKATAEATEGGTCPNLPDTQGRRGPVAKWREDDSRIAQSLASELKALADTASASTSTLVAMPKPADFGAVKAGFEAANKASDDITRLTGGGNYAADTLRVLESRRISTIERAGQSVSCGDSARLTYIERASTALASLAAMKPMPRMQPGVDIGDPHDVLTRSMLRSFNGVLAMATFGRAGSFAGDELMQVALQQHGIVNRETLAFVISILAEVALALTTLLIVRQGRKPYPDNPVDWIDADEQRKPQVGTRYALARGLAKRVANVFYIEPGAPEGIHAAGSGAAQHSGSAATTGLIELPEDPRLSRDREASWSGSLLQHHVSWGKRDFLFLPITREATAAARIAQALAYQGQAELVADSAPDRLLMEPEVATRLEFAHGPDWHQHRYQVYLLGPAYAQMMRLRAIDGGTHLAPDRQAHMDMQGSRHVPLRHRLAQRPGHRAQLGR